MTTKKTVTCSASAMALAFSLVILIAAFAPSPTLAQSDATAGDAIGQNSISPVNAAQESAAQAAPEKPSDLPEGQLSREPELSTFSRDLEVQKQSTEPSADPSADNAGNAAEWQRTESASPPTRELPPYSGGINETSVDAAGVEAGKAATGAPAKPDAATAPDQPVALESAEETSPVPQDQSDSEQQAETIEVSTPVEPKSDNTGNDRHPPDKHGDSGIPDSFSWQSIVETLTTRVEHDSGDLSPWRMFLAADIVVKAVMISLVLASLLSWAIWLTKLMSLTSAKIRAAWDHRRLSQANSLADAVTPLDRQRSPVAVMIRSAAREFQVSAHEQLSSSGVKERVASEMGRIEQAAGRRLSAGTSVLASVGSVGPFVGLFGTVWGIMNSFIGIAKSNTTNLAVVAPGIAEALLATGIGLVAAIPAVLFYNQLAKSIGGYKAQLGDSSAMVQRLVSRDLDRLEAGHSRSHLMAAE